MTAARASLRIALVAEDYYPQLGGVPEHVHHLALELNRRGHAATIVTSRMRGPQRDASFVRRVGTSVVLYAGLWANGDTWFQIDDVTATAN